MVTPVSTTPSSYLAIPLALTRHQRERIHAMQISLSLVTGEERDPLLEAIREFLSGFRAGIKEQIVIIYFEAIRSEIT